MPYIFVLHDATGIVCLRDWLCRAPAGSRFGGSGTPEVIARRIAHALACEHTFVFVYSLLILFNVLH